MRPVSPPATATGTTPVPLFVQDFIPHRVSVSASPKRSAGAGATPKGEPDDKAFFPLDRLRAAADRLARAATECGHQHERWAALCERSDVEDAEFRSWQVMVVASDQLLATAIAAYETCAPKLHPDGEDETWWRRANAMWHAGREWSRRHERADYDAARLRTHHTSVELGALAVDSALEASALLALRQAVDAYHAVRPASTV